MYVKALTLKGFKSFPSTTVLEFGQGINAVVGPNGSGKSNVVDAISWVLGEQGTKNLRAGAMSDVIFSGTSARPALGRAQVSLTIDNSDGLLPLPLTDIEVSRTVFKNGGSEYRINGEAARLSDVQELLGAAHLGKSKHSIITQGHIEKVLHASDATRRELLEEAAGISAYRHRAQQTEAKLEGLKANLDRLEDLEAELASQLEPLGEQAEAASSARELQAQIRQLRLQLTAQEAHQLAGQRDAARSRSEELDLHLAQAQQKIQGAHKEGEEGRLRVEQARGNLEKLRQEMTRLEKVLALTARVQAVAEERLKAPASLDFSALETALEDAQAQVENQKEKAGQLKKALQSLKQEEDKAQQEVKSLSEGCKELAQQIDGAEEAREKRRQGLLEGTADLARHKAHLDRATEELASRQAEEAAATEEGKKFTVQAENLTTRLEGLKAQEEKLRSQEKEAGAQRQKLVQRQQELQEQLTGLTLATERARATSQTLKASLPPVESAGKGQALFAALTIQDPWHTALARLIGDWDAAVLTPEADYTSSSSSWWGLPACPEVQLPHKLPAFLIPALDLVEAEEAFVSGLHRLLELAFVHRELDAAQVEELALFLAEHPQAVAVEADGTVRTAFGILSAEGTDRALELFARWKHAEELTSQALTEQKACAGQLAQLEEELEGARRAEKEAARASGVIAAELSSVLAELAHLKTRAQAASETGQLLAERSEKARLGLAEAQKAYTATQKSLAELEGRKVELNPADLRRELAQAQQTLERAQAQLARAQARAEAQGEAQEEAAGRLAQLTELVESRRKALEQAQEAQQERENLLAQTKRTANRALKLADLAQATLDELVQLSNQAQQELEEKSRELEEHRKAAETQQQVVESLRQQGAQAQILLGALETQWEVLAQKSQKELAEELDAVLEQVPEPQGDSEALTLELMQRQKELAAIGAVNPLALEEFQALSERHAYLAEQVRDVKKTRADLRAIIKELNERINREFSAAFVETNAHFERIFARLFPGGEGSLSLTDPTDLLATGIEIHARPAGKKVKRLSLLSGGERALASLALLTAIFAARPTPFYVLDEIEAALDDRNLGRLLEVLQELAQQSQLIVITHKTRTIEIADRLYGVSMKEGISMVLHQDMQQLRALLGQG